jgi:tRNA (Thr-GGU) A37 N-methylase
MQKPQEAIALVPIGRVESPLVDRHLAPRQGDEGAPDAFIVFDAALASGLRDLAIGEHVLVLTWFDRARRDVLEDNRIGVRNLEVLDGTPIVDVKPVLDPGSSADGRPQRERAIRRALRRRLRAHKPARPS